MLDLDKYLCYLVGVVGFEPTTSLSPFAPPMGARAPLGRKPASQPCCYPP
jgi:hypothetical protein